MAGAIVLIYKIERSSVSDLRLPDADSWAGKAHTDYPMLPSRLTSTPQCRLKELQASGIHVEFPNATIRIMTAVASGVEL